MKSYKRNLAIFGILLLVSCTGGLPPSLEREIGTENDRLQAAERQLKLSQDRVHQDMAQAPDLFQNASAPAEWTARLRNAHEKLDRAEDDSKELARLKHERRKDAPARAHRLLTEEHALREDALHESDAVEATAKGWLDFRHELPSSLDKMKREYEAIRAVDLAPAAKTVERSEQDWPAKKSALDSRLASLRAIPETAQKQWSATEAARQDAASGKASGAEVVTLIQADEALSQQEKTLAAGPGEMSALSGQLYDAWDKILTDLDAAHYGEDTVYRERLKTVRTHFIDVAAKKTETHSDERWTNVPEASFRAVENDLGMAIAHKDAGLFDSEAQNVPQPPGFAYVASPAEGSNQYGYWTHSGGENFWTFLPQYLLMRELLWNHDYRPVAMGEYGAYRMAQRSGSSYYGRETPASPPKYGSHGTFTQSHYADSRYVQSGGFKGSAYASRGSAGPASSFSRPQAGPMGGAAANENGAGHRFGRQAGSPSGQRFGHSGGFRPSGRGFGRRR
jgi:hypothetical protein